MDFDSKDCGAAYKILGKDTAEYQKIIGNEYLCKSEYFGLKLHKQSYSDNTCFYTLEDKYGDFRVDYGNENLQELINVLERENEINLHPGRSAKILIGKDRIASFGEVHPEVLENYGINEKVYYAVIDIEKFAKYGKDNKKYTPIPKYPAVERDIALVVDEDVEVGQIENIISKKAKNILERAELFDVYRSDKLGENKKSVAYELIFRAQDRTLTDDEIKNTMEVIIKELQANLGAELRT